MDQNQLSFNQFSDIRHELIDAQRDKVKSAHRNPKTTTKFRFLLYIRTYKSVDAIAYMHAPTHVSSSYLFVRITFTHSHIPLKIL